MTVNVVVLVLHVIGLLAFFPAQTGSQGGVLCYAQDRSGSGSGCPQNSFIARLDTEQCCRGEGVSFDFPDAETCMFCFIYGWLNGSSVELRERERSYLLQVGYEKGSELPGAPSTLAFIIDIILSSSTANSSDYTLSTNSIEFTTDAPASVELTLTADGVASEPLETLQLELVPQDSSQEGIPGIISNTQLTVNIVDADASATTSRPAVTTKAPESTPKTTDEKDSEETAGKGNGGLSAGQIGGLVAGLIAAVIVGTVAAGIIGFVVYSKTHVSEA